MARASIEKGEVLSCIWFYLKWKCMLPWVRDSLILQLIKGT